MASSDTQARFGQSVKGLLSDKVGSCSADVIALTRQVLKGSRSQELLSQAARNMVIQEDAILHSEDAGHNEADRLRNSESKENVDHNYPFAISAGSHPKECGALKKPSGPAKTFA